MLQARTRCVSDFVNQVVLAGFLVAFLGGAGSSQLKKAVEDELPFVSIVPNMLFNEPVAVPIWPFYPDFCKDPDRSVRDQRMAQVLGDYLYHLSSFRGLVVFDLAAGEGSEPLVDFTFDGVPFDMFVVGDRLHVISTSVLGLRHASGAVPQPRRGSRLTVIDISNPGSPAVVGQHDLRGIVRDAKWIEDNLVLVSSISASETLLPADDGNRTVISTFRDLAGSLVKTDQISHDVLGAYLSNHALWVTRPGAGFSRVQYFELSDRGRLLPGGEIEIEGFRAGRQESGLWSQVGDELRVVRSRDFRGAPVLSIFKVESRDRITHISTTEIEGGEGDIFGGVVFRGNLAIFHFLPVFFRDMEADVVVVDLRDPEKPVARSVPGLGGWINDLVIRGTRILAVGNSRSFPPATTPVQNPSPIGRQYPNFGAFVIDVSNPRRPEILDRLAIQGDYDYYFLETILRADQDFDYVVLPGRGIDGAAILDLRTPGRVRLADRFTIGSHLMKVTRFGSDLLSVSDNRMNRTRVGGGSGALITDEYELARDVRALTFTADHAVTVAKRLHEPGADLLVFPDDEPNGFKPVSRLPLSDVYFPPYDYYQESDPRLFSFGSFVYVVYRSAMSGKESVEVIDLSDPSNPTKRGKLEVPGNSFPSVPRSRWYDLTSMSENGGEVVQMAGSTLVFHRIQSRAYDPQPDFPATFIVVDLSDPDHPVLGSVIDGSVPVTFYPFVVGTSLLYAYYEPLNKGDHGYDLIKAKFYLNRVDLTDPSAPRQLPRINIPGRPIDISPDGSRLVTIDHGAKTEDRLGARIFVLKLDESSSGIRTFSDRYLGRAHHDVRVVGNSVFAFSEGRDPRTLQIHPITPRNRFAPSRSIALPDSFYSMSGLPGGNVFLGIKGGNFLRLDAGRGVSSLGGTLEGRGAVRQFVEHNGTILGVMGMLGVRPFK